jgi:hypothetical protein
MVGIWHIASFRGAGAGTHMAEKNRVRPEPSFAKNRGGRPRKDGTRADNAKTYAEIGISKRLAAEARLYASYPEDVFEAALKQHLDAKYANGKTNRVPPLSAFLPDHKHNSQQERYERDMMKNINRIISTARLILKANEFDASEIAEVLRALRRKIHTNCITNSIQRRSQIHTGHQIFSSKMSINILTMSAACCHSMRSWQTWISCFRT